MPATAFPLVDGFDVYPDVASTSQGLQSRWVASNTSQGYTNVAFVTGRFGGQAVHVAAQINGFPSGICFPLYGEGFGATSVTIGFAFNLQTSVRQTDIMGFLNGGPNGTQVWGVGVNNAQQVYLWVGSYTSVVAAMVSIIETGSWHYIEATWVGGVSGSLNLYLDGLSALSYSGNTGTASIDTLQLGAKLSANADIGYYDDVYVKTGSTRLGERRVETLNTAANSSVTWTPLANTNWKEVSEVICDGDASYNFTSTAGNIDLFGINSLAENPVTISTVQVRAAIRKTDATSRVTHTVLNSGGTQQEGADWAVAGTYLYDIDLWDLDPHTSAAWTPAAVDAALIGYKLVS